MIKIKDIIKEHKIIIGSDSVKFGNDFVFANAICVLNKNKFYDRRYFYLDDDIETEEKFVLRLTIKDKAMDKSLWTGFTSWNQNRLNDSSDTETIQALVNSLLQEL